MFRWVVWGSGRIVPGSVSCFRSRPVLPPRGRRTRPRAHCSEAGEIDLKTDLVHVLLPFFYVSLLVFQGTKALMGNNVAFYFGELSKWRSFLWKRRGSSNNSG